MKKIQAWVVMPPKNSVHSKMFLYEFKEGHRQFPVFPTRQNAQSWKIGKSAFGGKVLKCEITIIELK